MFQAWNMFQDWSMFQVWNMFQAWNMLQTWNMLQASSSRTNKYSEQAKQLKWFEDYRNWKRIDPNGRNVRYGPKNGPPGSQTNPKIRNSNHTKMCFCVLGVGSGVWLYACLSWAYLDLMT